MRSLALALAVVALGMPGAARAKGSCLERCSDNLLRCSNRCSLDAKCMQRCQTQLDSCNMDCGKAGDTRVPVPRKCPDAKGRMMPCENFGQPTGKGFKPPRR